MTKYQLTAVFSPTFSSDCEAYEDGIVLKFTSENQIDETYACVYPPGDKRNGGDIHFIGDEEWPSDDSAEQVYGKWRDYFSIFGKIRQ